MYNSSGGLTPDSGPCMIVGAAIAFDAANATPNAKIRTLRFVIAVTCSKKLQLPPPGSIRTGLGFDLVKLSAGLARDQGPGAPGNLTQLRTSCFFIS
jgi:hypothetical protein